MCVRQLFVFVRQLFVYVGQPFVCVAGSYSSAAIRTCLYSPFEYPLYVQEKIGIFPLLSSY